jgi:UDP-N-acetylglucosamine 3-dehydrogenase
MKQFHVGIVGAGLIAKDHARSLVRNPFVRAVSFFDVDAARAKEAAAMFASGRDSSIRELVARSDIVWVCTPPFGRREAIAEACRARKAIFCEKPLGISEADLRFVENAVKKAGVPFFMGQSGRYSEFFVKMKRLVAKGAIGKPTLVWSTRLGWLDPKRQPAWRFDDRLGGGTLIELGVHELDFIRWIGGDWRRVSAVALATGKFQHTVEGIGTLRTGAIARLTIGWANPRYLWQRGIEGETGSLLFDDSRVSEIQLHRPNRKPRLYPVGDWMDRRTKENLSLRDQDNGVLAALAKGRPPEVTLADGAAAVRAALAMRESARRGETVCLGRT